ncbi:rhamnosyltransferase [Hespellia stercorisuis DSM 15480]|uniref:Rhamnosyltransferase n=2 Tax=Hespellia stercorisuis TaxID=180311 RepID=A0A1M6Q6U9_9FIRM|nr:glycosyltransferase [Hespellia stercorisuis]SHK15878.1 rhamnosyltransferase [Hespellia stercorisuis DSM 15480]
MPMNKKTVDVIIPTYKPDETIKKLLDRLSVQTYPVQNIFIMNTRTEVDLPEELNQMDNIRIIQIEPEAFDHGGTRHRGARLSHADLILFMTQDAMPYNKQLVEQLVKAFEDEKVGAAFARQLPDRDCGVIERYTRSFNYPETGRVKSIQDIEELGVKTFFCSNVCAIYRKDVYDSLGGFEKKTIFNEDMIFAGRILQSGCKIAYVADAEVIHSHNYSCMQQFRRNFDLAVSQVEHPEVFEGVKSESEGVRLVSRTAGYLLKIRKPWLIINLVIKSGFKYMGYKLGQNYRKLPQWVVLKCTMNPRYWAF